MRKENDMNILLGNKYIFSHKTNSGPGKQPETDRAEGCTVWKTQQLGTKMHQ